MKRVVFSVTALVLSSALLLSCGYSPPSSQTSGTGVKFRAFISQSVISSTALPGLDIVDAERDRLVAAPGVVIGGTPGLMAVSANRTFTLVFDSSANTVNVIANKPESSAGTVKLPDWTQSLAVSPDATVAYAAVPNAPVAGQPSGAVEMMNLRSFTIQDTIPITGARYIALSPDSTHLLAFSDNSDAATLVTLQNTGTAANPNWVINGTPVSVPGFNRPVWGVFSSDSKTAYVLNCGPECGATSGTAGVTALDLSTATVGQSLPLPSGGATYGVLFGNTMYVAGNPPPASPYPCSTTSVNTCGALSVITINNGNLQLANTVAIPDGYHDRMAVTADNQVFVGSRACTNVNIPQAAPAPPITFGCLALYNPKNPGSAVIGTDLGDVTGIAPVTGRTEVYVVQNGEFRIWDTVKDALRPGQFQIDLVGQAVDVAVVD